MCSEEADKDKWLGYLRGESLSVRVEEQRQALLLLPLHPVALALLCDAAGRQMNFN